MTQRMKQILDNLHKYNTNHMANINFGLSEDIVYDALVVALSYSPYKIIRDDSYKMDIPVIALLVVSDNSATGVPLVGRSEEIQKIYDYSRKVVLIDLIYKIVKR